MYKLTLNILLILFILPVLTLSEPLIFVEEIQLEENRDHFINGLFGNISFDSNDNFYFLDSKAKNVKKYSPAGKLLKVIGKEGEGPGEFIFPQWTVVIGDKLYVSDVDGHYKVFSIDGNFIENSKFLNNSGQLYQYHNQMITTDYYKMRRFYAVVYSKNGNKLSEIGENKDFVDLMISPWNYIFMASDAKGNLYFIPQKGERIVKYNNKFQNIKQFGQTGKKYSMPSEPLPPMTFYAEKGAKYATKTDKNIRNWIMRYTPAKNISVLNDKYLVIEYGNYEKGYFLDIYNLEGQKLLEDYSVNMKFVGTYKNILYFLKIDEDAEFMYSICKYKLSEKELSRPLPQQKKLKK
ncbi:MAG: hypothetical protein JW737_05375 [Acidobacteria bacterium]|nr:hypothetical protein [Acidobacteriota bacterium]